MIQEPYHNGPPEVENLERFQPLYERSLSGLIFLRLRIAFISVLMYVILVHTLILVHTQVALLS